MWEVTWARLLRRKICNRPCDPVFFFFFFKLDLIYNVLSTSALQQSDQVIISVILFLFEDLLFCSSQSFFLGGGAFTLTSQNAAL